jgi:5-methylcytosine-specific restriction protein A
MTSGRWSSSTRTTQLPPGWRTRIRPRILERDPTCALHLPGCTVVSTEVDHVGDKHDHSDENLRGLCHPCHTQVTQQQAKAARTRKQRTRPTERHPGLL